MKTIEDKIRTVGQRVRRRDRTTEAGQGEVIKVIPKHLAVGISDTWVKWDNGVDGTQLYWAGDLEPVD